MNKYAYVLVLSVLVLVPNFALADDATSTPDIIDTGTSSSTQGTASTTPDTAHSTPLNIEGHVDVPATCDIVDTDGITHHFPEDSSPSDYLGICAIHAALESGLIAHAQFSNQFPSIGLFITTINDVEADASSQYWALYHNGGFADCGLGCLPVAAGDTIKLQLEDFSGNNLGDSLTLHIDSLIATSTATSTPPVVEENSSSGRGGSSSNDEVDIDDAIWYLISQQLSDGSLSSSLLTDWAAIAFASAPSSSAKSKLRDYLRTASPALSNVTDYERHAMALQALNINPYTSSSRDYIAPITNAFDGTQIGDSTLDNDDIFAIFPLLHADYTTSDEIIKKVVAFIVARQKTDGSWDGSVDVTAAAIQALDMVSSLPGTSDAIAKGEYYLRGKQQQNGGWENSFSTSWALQAIAALGQSASNWTPGSDTPEEYLAQLQQSDGGIDSPNTSNSMRIWATSYAIPAAQNKTWDSLLSSFSKPTAAVNPVLGTTTTQTATTTIPLAVASTTSTIATSTPLVLGAATSTSLVITPTPTPSTPAKPNKPVLTTRKKIAFLQSVNSKLATATTSTLSLETNSQTKTAAVSITQEEKPGFFARIWNFLKGLLGL